MDRLALPHPVLSRSSRLRIAALGLVLAAAPAAAQDAPVADAAPTVLTLDEALALALGRNIDLAQAQNSVAFAEVDVAQDRAAFGPSLSVTAGPSLTYARYGASSVVDSTGTVFDTGLRRANLDQSRSQLAATQAALSRAEEQTLYLTATQYLYVLQDAAVVRVNEEALAAQEQQLELIEAFYEAGNRSLADVLQQRATIAQSRQALVTARQSVATSLLDLKQTLRLGPTAEVAVAPVDTPSASATAAATNGTAPALTALRWSAIPPVSVIVDSTA